MTGDLEIFVLCFPAKRSLIVGGLVIVDWWFVIIWKANTFSIAIL
jgi:hypothetical protein